MTNHKPKRADMDVRSSEDRVIVTDPSGSAVRTTAVEYIWRAPLKGGVTDLEKAANVLEKAADYARGGLS